MDEEESTLQERLSRVETQAVIDKKQSGLQLTAVRKENDDLATRVNDLEQALLLEKEVSAQAVGLKKQLAAVHAELDRAVSASASAEQTRVEKDRKIQELNSSQQTTEQQLAMLSDDQSTLFKVLLCLEFYTSPPRMHEISTDISTVPLPFIVILIYTDDRGNNSCRSCRKSNPWSTVSTPVMQLSRRQRRNCKIRPLPKVPPLLLTTPDQFTPS